MRTVNHLFISALAAFLFLPMSSFAQLSAEDERIASRIVKECKQWIFGATKPRTVIWPKQRFEEHPDRSYSLKSLVPKKFLQHEDQTWGVNLGWTDDATAQTGAKVARWFFARNGSAGGPIRYGETVALGNGQNPSFLKLEQRTVGINLSFSGSPAFEWKILGGKIGDPVHTQELVVIFNERSENGECLMYFDRTKGGDIGWPSSRTWSDQVEGRLKEAVKKRILKEFGLD